MSVDDLIRDRLESLVEPVDVDEVITAIEARRGSRRRWQPFGVAAAAVLVVAGTVAAVVLGGGDGGEITAGPRSSLPPVSSAQEVTVRAEGLGPIQVTSSPLAAATGTDHELASHVVTLTNTGDAPVFVDDVRTGELLSSGPNERPGLFAATEGCGYGFGSGVPLVTICNDDYRPLGEIAPGASVDVAVTIWSGLPGLGPVGAGTYVFDIAVDHRSEPFQSPNDTGATGNIEVTYRNLNKGRASLAEQQDPAVKITLVAEFPSFSIPAGSTLSGQVVVNNDSGAPLDFDGCLEPFGAVLRNETYTQLWQTGYCLQTFTLPVGESTWPVTITASYTECVGVSGAGTGPPCGADDGPPPLPPGPYHVDIVHPPLDSSGQANELLLEVTPAP